MANRPSVPEIITVNSEALQTQIRDLLPSQNGFGSELQATNVITPIIDLTAAAEGSGVRADLQTAIAFGSQTSFAVSNATSVIANNPGFYRIFGRYVIQNTSSGITLSMTDGLSTKNIIQVALPTSNATLTDDYDFIIFLAAGESMSATSSNTGSNVTVTVRQIATGDGTLVNPNGFPL